MFRDRPLTWLFVIATICVDLTLRMSPIDPESYWVLVLGYLLGQVAALAIWAIRGSFHRLLRASCFVLSTGLLVSILFPGYGEVFAFVLLYATAVFCTALLIEMMRNSKSGTLDNNAERNRWRFPLIEWFGWSIVVAIVSIGCRYMEFTALFRYPETWLQLLATLAVPLLLVIFICRDLQDLSAFQALLIVGATTCGEWYVGSYLIVTQAAYLVFWLTVLTFDNVHAEAANLRSKLLEETRLIGEPQLFNPQD